MKVHTAYWPAFSLGQGLSASPETDWAQRLHRVWQSVLAHFNASDEPRVWPNHDPAGTPAWNAYDPITGQSVHLVSEAELRTWLEELHYQDQRLAEARQADLKLLWGH